MKSMWLETYFWGLGNIWNYWEYLRPSVLCHHKLTKHHLLLSASWIRCVSLACKLSMAGSTRYLCGFHKSQLRAAIGCYYSVGKSWRACYLVTTGFERKWVFEAVVIKSEAQVQCCLCCLDGNRFINVFCINLAFISQPFCMFWGFFTLF